jgi:hypothetical protein
VREGLESVAFANLDQIGQACSGYILAGVNDLRGLELGADEEAATVVLRAAARWSVETPKEVPNSIMDRAPGLKK